jgi:hypothetical protein
MLVLPLPVLAACSGLIGLDEFQKGECPGARCGDGGGIDVINPLPPPPPPPNFEAGPPPGDGAAPVSWAKWKMPNYGEAGLPNLPTYTVADAGDGGVVTDNITGLVWQQSTQTPVTFEDALGVCHAPWRLPKRIELVTLIDYSAGAIGSKPFIDTTFFPGVSTERVWTSSEVRDPIVPFSSGAPDAGYWAVGFDNGLVSPQIHTLKASVLCVKGQ